MKTKKYSKGFTLVELLVAMSIIAVLSSVVLVALNGQRDKARSSAALMVAKSVMPAAMECNLRAMPLVGWANATSGGNIICNGSGVTWPALNTPSTSGWSWWGVNGVSADLNNYYYYLYNSTTSTYVLCPITYTGWNSWLGTNTVLPGTCVVVQ